MRNGEHEKNREVSKRRKRIELEKSEREKRINREEKKRRNKETVETANRETLRIGHEWITDEHANTGTFRKGGNAET